MVLDALAQQVVNGLVVGMVFVLLASGLSIIFGVMDVINFTHGELFALGAYFAFAVASTSWGGFWVALVLAPLGVALVGGAIERFTIRPLYGRNPLYHILLTFGLVLIFKDVIDFVWGTSRKFYRTPELLSGQPFQVAGLFIPQYSAFVIVGGALVAGVSYLLLERTRFGLIVRAGSMDREMVRHLGIDIDRYYTLVFAYGALLAALAGIVIAGRSTIEPAMGDSVIIPAFVIVVLGGLGSFRGAVVGGLGVGVIQSLLSSTTVMELLRQSWTPTIRESPEGLVVFLLMIGVLLVRPQGLFGSPEFHDPSGDGELLTGAGGGVLDSDTRRRLGYVVIGLLALAPIGMGAFYPVYYVNSVLVLVMIWALFALSLDFLMGYTGLVPLGHVLFFGAGAYTSVLFAQHVVPSVFLAILAGVVVSALLAWVVGYLSIRVSGVYFAMITLAFAELGYQMVFKRADIFGGENGISGFDMVYGVGSGPAVGELTLLGEIHAFYYLVLASVVGGYLVARRLMRSPFGSVLKSVREAEERATFLGYDVTVYKRRAFVISGALASVAGSLATLHTGAVSPSSLAWIKSGEVIVITLLGGMGTLYGPMIGAGAFFGLKETLLAFDVEQWRGVLGVVFVLFVIYVPEGLVSVPSQLSDRYDFGGGGDPTVDPTPEAETGVDD
jgi:branched-chain amino acid transport system permease protein